MKKKLISLVAAGILCASLALPTAAQDCPSLGAFQSIYEAISAFFGQFGSETSEVTPPAGPFSVPGGVTAARDSLEASPMTMPGGATSPGDSPEVAPYIPPGGLAAVENSPEAAPYTMPGG